MKTISELLDANEIGEIDLSQQIVHTPHVIIVMRFLDSSGNEVTPIAGSFSITIKVSNSQVFHSIIGGDNIDATAELSLLSYSGNGQTLKYSPLGITRADKIEIKVLGNTT